MKHNYFYFNFYYNFIIHFGLHSYSLYFENNIHLIRKVLEGTIIILFLVIAISVCSLTVPTHILWPGLSQGKI